MNTNQSIIARRYSLLCLVVGILFTLGVGNAWAGHSTHTATLEVKVGAGSGTVYASTSNTAASGEASASFNCGKSSDGQHTGDLYAFATPAAGYTFLGWTTSNTSTEGADKSNPKSVAFDVTDGSSTQTLYAYFVEKAKVNITFVAPSNGTYTIKVNGGSAETVSSSDVVKNNVTDVTLTATPASGYAFAGWYKLNSAGEFVEDLSITSPYDASFTKSETIKMGARFVPTTLGKFILKGSSTEYYGLKAATIAAGGSGTIVPVAEETLVDGSDLMPFDNGTYTIKAGATLLVPYSSANEVQTKPKDIAFNSTGWTKALSIYKKLKLGEGVNIKSDGVICVGGQLVSYNGGNPSAYPIGACGVIDMSSGGHIELNGTLYCWGFIKGQDMDQGNNTTAVGTITANNGSVIWEDFAVGDWRGGSACVTIANNASSWKFFPFQSYTIQNVEVPTTYKYGSTLSNYTNVYGGGGKNEGTFSLIGNLNTLFLLKDASSFVRKWYDPTTDLVNYELSGTAQLDALNVDAGITTVSSSSYNLPISSNMQIVLTNCNMTISKPMIVQPGAVIEIKNDATLTFASNAYIFDVDNWGMYCNGRYFYSMDILTNHKNRGTGTSKELLDDATLIVDGTLNVTGKLYTTAGGADIMGNGGGSVKFSSLGGSGNIVMCTGVSTNENVAIAQANMHNEDDSYTQAEASTFYNVNSRWFITGKQNINSTTHVYDEFTYISSGAVSGTDGTTTTTKALYGQDKTGLVAGMKWCNVSQDGTCPAIYNATQDLNGTPAANIRYTYQSSDWLQLLKTETEGVYGGSDNRLYAVDGCAVNSLGSVDENCLYTIDGVKKALVDGHFVALTKNTNDEAWHNTANASEYYISFAGCTWHPATKYAGEEKAYIVEDGIYIWYNNDWLLVEREDPFFFDYNDQNVKRYYEYENDEWVLASPRVRVVDAIETREFYKLPEAIAVANGKKNATITILKDISGIATSLSFTAANTTCTLDLNGHTVQGTANKLLNINGSGSTFTITDSQTGGTLKMTGTPNNACYYNVYVTNGSLVLNKGIISVDNAATYSGDNYALCAVGVASGKSFTMNGGTIYARVDRRAYGIESNGTTNINGGTITCQTLRYAYPYGVQVKAGTTTIKNGVTITTTAGTTYSFPVYQTGGTLNVTGGTMTATAPTTSNNSYFNSAIRIDGGTANISGGTLSATVTGNSNSKNAYGIYSKGTTTISNCVVSATTKTSGAYAVYTAGGTTTVKSGKFKASAPSAVAGVYKNAGTITIEDGYFVQNTNLEANLAANRGVYKLTSGTEYSEGYQYDIDKAYTLTWVTDGNNLTGNYTNGKTRVGATITKPSTPTKTGYTFKEWTPTPAATMPSEDKTYTATWTPNTNTKYTVKHMREALDGTYPAGLTETENKTGTTATLTAATAKTYTGFTALPITQETIAGDGTTVVNIYYNRKTYTIAWVDGNNVVIETDENVAYGTTPTYDGETPTKDADASYVYTFNTWTPAVGAIFDNTTYTATYNTTPTVASVTDGGETTYYATLAYAIATANGKTNPVVTMLKNASVASEITISAAMTIDLNGKTISSILASATGVLKIAASGKTVTIRDSQTGGKIDHTASYSDDHLYGINLTAGTLNIESGTIYAKNTAAKRAYGIYNTGTTTLNIIGGTIEATSTTSPFGIYDNSNCTLTMTGGTFTASGSSSRGIYTKGTTTLTDATITASGSSSYAIFAKAGTMTINSGTYTATETNSYAIYYEAGTVTVNDGRFSGAAGELTPKTSYGANVKLKGGYYVHDTDLEDNCAANYHALPLIGEDPYKYEVAEAYIVTFNANGHGTDPATQTIKKGGKATEPDDPTADGYTFGGWYKEETCTNAWNFSTDVVNAATTLYAKWTISETGDLLDIVDWEVDGSGKVTAVTLNMNGYTSATAKSDWKVRVIGIDKTYNTDDRDNHALNPAQDRTMRIDLSSLNLTADGTVAIEVLGTADALESHHNYRIPHIVTPNTPLSGTTDESIVYVREGKLTLNTDLKVKKMIVCPGAELEVNSELTCTDSLVLRTEAYKSAILTDNGTISAKNVYYTRHVEDKINTYPFGLPFDADISGHNVKLSNGVELTHGTDYGLLEYDGDSRANQGKADDKHSNWKMTTTTLTAGKGYQLASTSRYYYELYFPVKYKKTTPTLTVSVSYHTGSAGKMAAGWNYLVSPFTQEYHCESFKQPEELLKISVLNSDGKTYDQFTPTSIKPIKPATPFFYQAEEDQVESLLYFADDGLHKKKPAPRRMGIYNPSNDVPTQWIELLFGNAADELDIINNADRTNIYLHPTKFSAEYEIGYDVTKLSTQGARPLLWVKTVAGDLAFAALPDSLAQSLPLTVSVPAEGAYTFALNENGYTSRIENIILLDALTGTETDLRRDTYTCLIEEGQTTARFFLNVKMKQQGVTTEVDELGEESAVDRPVKLFIDGYIYILMPDGRMYDAVGKRVK